MIKKKGFSTVVYLQIRNSSSSYDSKHDHEHPSNHRCRDGCEDCSNFSQDPHQNHDESTQKNHCSTAHLLPNETSCGSYVLPG